MRKDSVTILVPPPHMILPVTILPSDRNLSVIHLPPPCQVHLHLLNFSAYLDHTRVIFRQVVFIPIHMYMQKRLNMLVPVIPGALYVVSYAIRNPNV